MLDVLNISTLALLGYIDYVSYKIPNVILGGWLGVLVLNSFINLIAGSTAPILPTSLIASLLVAGSYFPLNHIVKCNAGDFKLYGVLTLSKGLDDSLTIILISLLISLFPIAGGKKKVPMAFMTFLGYIAFIVLKNGRIL